MNNLNRSNGFTLIEVLISMLILTVGLLGFSTLQGKNATGNAKSQAISAVTLLADSELERMINTKYDECLDYNSSVSLYHKIYVILCDVEENATAGYKDVAITISVDGENSTFEYIKTKNYD